MSFYQKHVFMCLNQRNNGKQCCAQAGSEEALQYVKAQLRQHNLLGENKVRINKAGCMGRCALGPTMVVYPDAVWYRYEGTQDLDEIIEQHLLHGNVVKRLLI